MFGFYNSAASTTAQKEAIVQSLVNGQLTPLGYDTLGLQGSDINAHLISGGYTATNSDGCWTQFDIDPATQNLLVTTYGITPYGPSDLTNNLAGVLAETPQIVSQFEVAPSPEPTSLAFILTLSAGLLARRRRSLLRHSA